MEYAEHLIERILAAPDNPRVGVLANELLREFQRGYSIDRLRPLLASCDNEVVATATWIASELAAKARPLLGELRRLLENSEKRVRFHALDCLCWASVDNGVELAAGIRLLNDADSGVRWKAMNLVASLSAKQLEAALGHLGQSERDLQLTEGLAWLLKGEADTEAILSNMRSGDVDLRRFAVIAAARYGGSSEKRYELMREAAMGEKDEVSEFAKGKMR